MPETKNRLEPAGTITPGPIGAAAGGGQELGGGRGGAGEAEHGDGGDQGDAGHGNSSGDFSKASGLAPLLFLSQVLAEGNVQGLGATGKRFPSSSLTMSDGRAILTLKTAAFLSKKYVDRLFSWLNSGLGQACDCSAARYNRISMEKP